MGDGQQDTGDRPGCGRRDSDQPVRPTGSHLRDRQDHEQQKRRKDQAGDEPDDGADAQPEQPRNGGNHRLTSGEPRVQHERIGEAQPRYLLAPAPAPSNSGADTLPMSTRRPPGHLVVMLAA